MANLLCLQHIGQIRQQQRRQVVLLTILGRQLRHFVPLAAHGGPCRSERTIGCDALYGGGRGGGLRHGGRLEGQVQGHVVLVRRDDAQEVKFELRQGGGVGEGRDLTGHLRDENINTISYPLFVQAIQENTTSKYFLFLFFFKF